MFRKIVLGIVITLALAVAGGWMFLRTQGDVILQKFSHLVEKNTGKPLHMETLPEISLFPGLSLTLGPSSWGEQEDAVSVSFSRASIRLSASALLAGRMELTGLEADDLQILCRFPSARPPAASSPAGQSASPAAAEDSPVQDAAGRSLEERVNSLLALAPDAAILNRASIVLTWEDGRSCAFSDIALKLTNARPNATLGLEASGHVSFRQKPNDVLRRAGLSLESNLACKNGAFTAIVHKALIHPEEHMGFTQDAALSGGMSWTPESGVLELNRLETSMPGLTLSASGTLSAPDMARLLATAPHDLPEHVLLKGTGGIQASCKGSPRLLLQALGRNPFPDETALSALNASAVLSLKSGHLVLEKLEGSLDGTSFSGSLDAGIEPPMLRGRLNLGELVPTRYAAEPGTEENSASIPRVTERRTENGATVLVVQPWPALDLTLTVERLVWRNLLLNNIPNQRRPGHIQRQPAHLHGMEQSRKIIRRRGSAFHFLAGIRRRQPEGYGCTAATQRGGHGSAPGHGNIAQIQGAPPRPDFRKGPRQRQAGLQRGGRRRNPEGAGKHLRFAAASQTDRSCVRHAGSERADHTFGRTDTGHGKN